MHWHVVGSNLPPAVVQRVVNAAASTHADTCKQPQVLASNRRFDIAQRAVTAVTSHVGVVAHVHTRSVALQSFVHVQTQVLSDHTPLLAVHRRLLTAFAFRSVALHALTVAQAHNVASNAKFDIAQRAVTAVTSHVGGVMHSHLAASNLPPAVVQRAVRV